MSGSDKLDGWPKMLLAGIFAGLSFWLVDSAVDAHVFKEHTLSSQLFHPEPVEVWTRLFVLALFTSYGLHVQNALDRLGRTESALAEERNRLENILANAADAISIQDRDLRITYQNRSFIEIVGDRIGEFCYKAYEDRDKPCDACPVKAAFHDGRPHTVEKEVHTGGRDAVVEITAAPLRDLSGSIASVIETVRNVSDRKSAEEALRRRLAMETAISRISCSLLSTHGPDITPELRVLGESAGSDHAFTMFFDPALRRVSGFYEWSAPGVEETDGNLVAGLDLGGFGAWVEKLLSDEEIYVPDCLELKDDPLGEACAAFGVRSILMVPIFSDGRLAGAMGLDDTTDVRHWSREDIRLIRISTGVVVSFLERKKAEEALKESERRLRDVLENVQMAAVMLDRDCRITFCNDYLLLLTGWTGEEVLGRDWCQMFIPPDSRREIKRMFAGCMERGEIPPHYENDIVTRGGRVRTVSWSNTVVRDGEGRIIGTTSIGEDITERLLAEERLREHEAQLEVLAHHDPLTGLPNRLLFSDRLEVALSHAHRYGRQVALMFIDLDNFKAVNDSLGHSAGDDLLVDASKRIHGCVRDCDTVARLGGDEFGVVLPDVVGVGDAVHIAERMIDSMRQPFSLEGLAVHCTASIGIALFPDDGSDAQNLLKMADNALYKSKFGGRNRLSLLSRAELPGEFPL